MSLLWEEAAYRQDSATCGRKKVWSAQDLSRPLHPHLGGEKRSTYESCFVTCQSFGSTSELQLFWVMDLGSGKRLCGKPSICISEKHIWFLYGYFCVFWQEKSNSKRTCSEELDYSLHVYSNPELHNCMKNCVQKCFLISAYNSLGTKSLLFVKETETFAR